VCVCVCVCARACVCVCVNISILMLQLQQKLQQQQHKGRQGAVDEQVRVEEVTRQCEQLKSELAACNILE
jgi:hypothetical protein